MKSGLLQLVVFGRFLWNVDTALNKKQDECGESVDFNGLSSELSKDVPPLGLLQRLSQRVQANPRKAYHVSAGVKDPLLNKADTALPILTPVGRTYYSSDPKASVDWWLRYVVGTKRIRPPSYFVKSCSVVDAVRLTYQEQSMYMVFIKDFTWHGSLHPDAFVNSSETEWQKVVARQFSYSPWMDFHDGITWSVFNLEHFAADGLQFQRYLVAVLRSKIPYTAWTIEFVPINNQSAEPDGDSNVSWSSWQAANYESPDLCRKEDFVDTHLMWWKSTFAAKDPLAAVEFAESVLGAFRVQSPYPWPRKPNCTASLWVRLPTSDITKGLELHFAQSLEYPPGTPSIVDFHDYQESIHDLAHGKFDEYMQNSLVFEAESLDPFVERLQSLRRSYLALELPDSRVELLFTFPRNEAIVVRIQSKHLTLDEPKRYDSCSTE